MLVHIEHTYRADVTTWFLKNATSGLSESTRGLDASNPPQLPLKTSKQENSGNFLPDSGIASELLRHKDENLRNGGIFVFYD